MSFWSWITCRGTYTVAELRAANTVLSSEGFRSFHVKFNQVYRAINDANDQFLDLNSDVNYDSKALAETPAEQAIWQKGIRTSKRLLELIPEGSDKYEPQEEGDILRDRNRDRNKSKSCFPGGPLIIGGVVFVVAKILLHRNLRTSLLASTILTGVAFVSPYISAYCTKTPEQQAQHVKNLIDNIDVSKPPLQNLEALNRLFDSTLANHVSAILYMRDRNTHER